LAFDSGSEGCWGPWVRGVLVPGVWGSILGYVFDS